MKFLRRWSLVALVAAAILSSCGGGESGGEALVSDVLTEPTAVAATTVVSEGTEPETQTVPVTSLTNFEIFAIDDSAGCSVYVSTSLDEAASVESEAAAQILGALYASENPCDYTEPSELGLITVDELDAYGQPAWGSVVPHFYFTVADWSAVGVACEGAVDSDACSTAIVSNFAQV